MASRLEHDRVLTEVRAELRRMHRVMVANAVVATLITLLAVAYTTYRVLERGWRWIDVVGVVFTVIGAVILGLVWRNIWSWPRPR